jgi:hypothetical protein
MTRTYSPPLLHYVPMSRFMITYTSCFTMGKVHMCGGCSQSAGLNYGLILGPNFSSYFGGTLYCVYPS